MLHKPVSLRTVLLAQVQAIRDNPENLSMFIDKGRVISRATGSPSFQYNYTLNIVVQDYAGDIDKLILPILLWIQREEPELLERAPHEPLTLESEIIDASSADVSINLELSERVIVTPTDDGKYSVNHLPERLPAPAFDADGATLETPLIYPDPSG